MRISTAVGSIVNVDWLYQIRQGKAFTARAVLGGAVGNSAHVQILNPAASGKTAIIHAMSADLAIAAILLVTLHNTALTTLIGNGVNLDAGGPVSACEVRSQQNPAILGSVIREWQFAAAESSFIIQDWFVMLGPGEGVVAVSFSQNVSLDSSWEWTEL